MKKFSILAILILVFAACGQQGKPVKPGEETKSFSLQFVEHESPQNKDSNKPVVFLLHGYGSNLHDLLSLSEHLDPSYSFVAVQAPHKIREYSYSWFNLTYKNGTVNWLDVEEAGESIDQLHTFIETYRENKNIKTKNFYALGFSQGASMALEMAIKYPESLAGVVALSGRLVWDRNEGEHVSEKVCQVDIFQAHGTLDRVIPMEDAQKVGDYFSSCPNFTFKKYPQAHEISRELVADINSWLESRSN
ncbi:MAG: dienelactone hydrolase family protein [Bacteroidales bacterium]|nr:dienelactone hydrolase family protein [Bacteroidales bacterium]MCF8457113.1 dienelactone hydrolase family protein [Bacteroidales bacterium]